jgi:hypothetical protein
MLYIFDRQWPDALAAADDEDRAPWDYDDAWPIAQKLGIMEELRCKMIDELIERRDLQLELATIAHLRRLEEEAGQR